MAKVLASTSASVLPTNIQDWFPLGLIGLISLGVDLQGTLKCLLKHHRSKASILLQFSYNWIADSIIRYTPIQNRKLKRKKNTVKLYSLPKAIYKYTVLLKIPMAFFKETNNPKICMEPQKTPRIDRTKGQGQRALWTQGLKPAVKWLPVLELPFLICKAQMRPLTLIHQDWSVYVKRLALHLADDTLRTWEILDTQSMLTRLSNLDPVTQPLCSSFSPVGVGWKGGPPLEDANLCSFAMRLMSILRLSYT